MNTTTTATRAGSSVHLPRDWPAAQPFSVQPWASRAACRGRTDLFFGPKGERADQREAREAEARALCLSCSALEPCRSWSRQKAEYGFWGGETEEERAMAGYPVALPVGRVARAIRAIRTGRASNPQASRY